MLEYLIYIGTAIFMIATIGVILYSIGKKKGVPEVNEYLEDKLKAYDYFKDLAIKIGNNSSKVLVQNMEAKKQVIKWITVDSLIPEFFTAKEEQIPIKKSLNFNKEAIDKLKKEYGSIKVPHKVLLVKELNPSLLKRIKGDTEVVLVPETKIVFENDEKIVLDKDLDLRPFYNSDLWLPNYFSSINLLTSVAIQDTYESLLSVFAENQKTMNYLNIEYATAKGKLEAVDSDNFRIGVAGDINEN